MNILQLDGYDLLSSKETEHDYHLRVSGMGVPDHLPRNLGASLSTLWQDFRGGEEGAESTINYG